VNEHCPIYQGYPKWPIHQKDVDDEFIQSHGYATIYDDGQKLVSLGDTAFQMYPAELGDLSLTTTYVRYIGRYAFQDCVNLKMLDFSLKLDSFIPVLASPTAFMMQDGETFVNDTFQIKVPARLLDEWKAAPNWAALKNHIIGA